MLIPNDLAKQLDEEYSNYTIYPPREKILRALELCPLWHTKVAILGQDPYHQPGQANGLAFAVNNQAKIPPSLRNIYKEIASDLQVKIPTSTSLHGWARQGVLLLNTYLTVREGAPLSHKHIWENFTDDIIKQLNKFDPIVFILWGAKAQKKEKLIDSRHYILKSAHPSPLSARKFYGCKHFSKTNEILGLLGKDAIDWTQID